MKSNVLGFYLWIAFWIIIIIVLLASCSPAKRMQRICNKHPELCKRDTFKIDGEVQVLNDTIYQDSIITLVLNECDSILKARSGDTNKILIDRIRIKKIIKPSIPVYKCLTDTLKIDFKNGHVKVWQVQDKFKYEVINIQPPIVIVELEKSWHDRFKPNFGVLGMLLVFLSGIGAAEIFRVIKK
jgi:hypothetical protein